MVCMPSKKNNDALSRHSHPISNGFRHKIEEIVLEAYEKKLSEAEVPQHS